MLFDLYYGIGASQSHDEDRLTKMGTPSATDTYAYNGLGLRVGKTDTK